MLCPYNSIPVRLTPGKNVLLRSKLALLAVF